MKRVVCLLLAILLCVGLVLPMVASAEVFVPSNGVDLVSATVNGEDVAACLVVTSVPEAESKTTEISQDARDQLVVAYDELSDETLKLITEGDPRFLELLDVHFVEGSECAQLLQELKKDGVTMTATFKLTVEKGLSVVGMSYLNGEWHPVHNVVDNGNGTVTCELEDEGPVVFIVVKTSYLEQNPNAKILVAEDEYHYSTKTEFVPSVTYKEGPVVVDVDTNIKTKDVDWSGDGIDECIVVTNVKQARNKSTDLSQEARDLLIEVYEAMERGEMVLPLKDGYVVRELVDVSFKYEACQLLESHGDKDSNLTDDGTTLSIIFDMDLDPEEKIIVMTYINGEWVPVEDVENNGDGTLTCVFEDICPVAFIKEGEDIADRAATDNPFSGDPMVKTMGIWVGLMVVCVVGIVVLVVSMNRKRK